MTTETLEKARERLRPYVERVAGFTGWDFSRVKTKHLPPTLPWSYVDRCRALISSRNSVLDIGTGGGERFEEIRAGHSGMAVATESWPPNALVAAQRLKPRRIDVVQCADEALPFADAKFDLILNRHSGWSAADVARVLKPGGTFLTQQVDDRNWHELRPFFPARQTDYGGGFEHALEGLRSAGFEIAEARRHESGIAYEDLGHLVMNILMAPWEVTDFDPLGTDLPALLDLERQLTTPDGVLLTEARSLIEARK